MPQSMINHQATDAASVVFAELVTAFGPARAHEMATLFVGSDKADSLTLHHFGHPRT